MSATTVLPADPAEPSHDVLVRLCREKRWQAVIDHVRSHPSDVKTAGVNGGNGAGVNGGNGDNHLPPLHVACQGGAPIQVVRALLAADASASRTRGGPRDRLPLHFLLAATTVPPHSDVVVSALVEAYPGACRVPDGGGNLPIHLACMAARVPDGVFTSILSTYPEGAYARNLGGMYPLHLAASNGDAGTRKVALAALDRGTLYASISKMTAIRLSGEHEAEIKATEERQAEKLNAMEARGKEERAKLETRIDGLATQLKNEREVNSALRVDSKTADMQHEEKLALAVRNERAKASDMENRLRSELAEVQLKNMDFLDQIEGVQSDLSASNERAEKQANEFSALERKVEDTIKILADTTDELESTSRELEQTRDELASARAASEDKSKYILRLESSLRDARTCMLAFANEQERVESAMAAQRGALAASLLGHDAAINDIGALGKNMLELVSTIAMAVGKDEDA